MTPEQEKVQMLHDLIEGQKKRIAEKLFSPQFNSFPLHTSKALLVLVGELVSLTAKYNDLVSAQWGDR